MNRAERGSACARRTDQAKAAQLTPRMGAGKTSGVKAYRHALKKLWALYGGEASGDCAPERRESQQRRARWKLGGAAKVELEQAGSDLHVLERIQSNLGLDGVDLGVHGHRHTLHERAEDERPLAAPAGDLDHAGGEEDSNDSGEVDVDAKRRGRGLATFSKGAATSAIVHQNRAVLMECTMDEKVDGR